MTQPPREVLDYLAALTDDEFNAVSRTARAPELAPQLTRADLKTMSAHEIEAAREAGRLDALQGVPAEETELVTRARRLDPVSRAELAGNGPRVTTKTTTRTRGNTIK